MKTISVAPLISSVKFRNVAKDYSEVNRHNSGLGVSYFEPSF
jgi:hypothetical protein